VTGHSDHGPEMPPVPLLDDVTIDALIDGHVVPPDLDHLAAFAAGVRAVADRPAPHPTAALQAVLTGDAPVTPSRDRTGHRRSPARRRSALAKVASLGLAAKIGVAATAAAAGVAGAGAAKVLPGDADEVVRDAIEIVTPVEFTEDGDLGDDGPNDGGPGPSDGGPEASEPAGTSDPAGSATSQTADLPQEHGDAVSSDATGESDGEPGVDGPTVADQAPGTADLPADPPGRSDGTPSATVPPPSDRRDDLPGASAPAAPQAPTSADGAGAAPTTAP
jgi:hypothetical protein